MFGTKEEKQEKKMQKFLKKYHLDNIDEKDMEILDNISKELTGLAKFGTIMTMKVEEQAKVGYLSTLVDQNWMIIRKLDEISKKLDK